MFTLATISHRPEIHDKAREIMEACPAVTIAHACLAMRDREDYGCDLLSVAEKEALVIVGEGDPIISVETAKKMSEAMPEAKLVVIKECSHLATMEQPAEVNRVVREFVQAIAK